MKREPKVPAPSGKEATILRLLVEGGGRERYGLELVAASGGHLKRGTIYVTLGRLEEKGFVTSRQEDKAPGVPGIPRRLYKITGVGQRGLEARDAIAAAMGLEPGYAT